MDKIVELQDVQLEDPIINFTLEDKIYIIKLLTDDQQEPSEGLIKAYKRYKKHVLQPIEMNT